MTDTKERPILFSAPMIRALLDGSKTQTRRVVKGDLGDETRLHVGMYHPTITDRHGDEHPGPEVFGAWTTDGQWAMKCPYGKPGDTLWVREAWSEPTSLDPGPTFYRADYPFCVPRHFSNVPPESAIKWKPSIHMRRDQSRITLEVTDVRVERLQDISEADAVAEGTPCYVCGGPMNGLSEDDCHCFHNKAKPSDYRILWESINGPESWEANPWVWAVSFRKVATTSIAPHAAPARAGD